MKSLSDIYNSLINKFKKKTNLDIYKGSVMDKYNIAIADSLHDVYQEIENNKNPHIYTNLSGSDIDSQQCKDQNQELVKERKDLLASNGYPEDYLNMQYDCPDCEDTGYINGEKCHCFKKAAVDLLYTQSNMREILQKENFSHFSFDYYSDTIRDEITGLTSRQAAHDAVMKARQFIDSFGKEFHNLFLHGNTGVGKTFLTNCIAKELIDRAHCVIYFSAFDLFHALAQNTFQRDASTEDIQEDILTCDLLIIDDLGTELTNSFVTTALFQCINERILRKKPTIISTNLSLDQFKDLYSERIYSRITSN